MECTSYDNDSVVYTVEKIVPGLGSFFVVVVVVVASLCAGVAVSIPLYFMGIVFMCFKLIKVTSHCSIKCSTQSFTVLV